ncbi:hypothetical protein V6N13_027375 [Hibiscus sabdariffa]
MPTDKGDVPEGCHEAVAPEPGLVAEAVDPTTFQQDAGLKKPTGDLHVENTEPVLHKQAAVSSEPVLTKENVDFPEPLLPKQVAGNTKPTTSMQYVDENAPVRVQQAAVMESPAIGVSPTRTKRSLQGKYEGTITDEAKTAFLEAKREHKSLLDKDEAYWAQRARVTWLTQRDRNTAYFHARASGRRKKNRIRGLFDESGIWTDKQAEVAGVAMRYFSTLFSSSQPTPNSTLLPNIAYCISSDDNSSLLRPS